MRERKGSFFTPKQWVQLSQQYLADVLGEDWQEEYYVWDCAAGTGNLLAGLTNKRNLFASTLDKADVAIMKESAREGALSLFEGNIFQFDFLNDDINGDKVPDALKAILNDPEKRKKLVIYINPPYSTSGNKKTKTQTGENKDSVATSTEIYKKFSKEIGAAADELYAQFLIRIKKEINGCILAQFSTLNTVQAPNFKKFRYVFCCDLKSLFIVPSYTFDNVPGKFSIGFYIWDTSTNTDIKEIQADVFNANGEKFTQKLCAPPPEKLLANWLKTAYSYRKTENIGSLLGYLKTTSSDYSNNDGCYLTSLYPERGHYTKVKIVDHNLFTICIFLAVRFCMPPTWLNDKDQFLYPKDSYKDDIEFQSNCLAFMLFHNKNRISAKEATNHWIPFTEDKVRARQRFQSDFMTKFINGKYKPKERTTSLLLDTWSFNQQNPLIFLKKRKRFLTQDVRFGAIIIKTLTEILPIT